MAIDDLVSLIERLRERIRDHSAILGQNEALTRYVLIDPLLRDLGWDTEDPTQVRPEYSAGNGRADYALMSSEKPLAMIEAKKLNDALADATVAKTFTYCLSVGTQCFIVTDGRHWHFYDPQKPGYLLEDRRISSFDITEGSAPQVVIQALTLWRSNFAPAEPVPLLAPQTVPDQAPIAVLSPAPSTLPPSSWVSLADLKAKPKDKPPKSLRLPDGRERPLSYWYELVQEAGLWLCEKGLLTSLKCPIAVSDGSKNKFLINIQPRNPNGSEFPKSKKGYYRIDSLYLNTKYNVGEWVRGSKYLIGKVGKDPANFAVMF